MAVNPEELLNTVSFTLNGKAISAAEDETILDVAKREGIDIPHLCYSDRQGDAGNCRACMVEVDGERVLAPSCCRNPTENMVVKTDISVCTPVSLLRCDIGQWRQREMVVQDFVYPAECVWVRESVGLWEGTAQN